MFLATGFSSFSEGGGAKRAMYLSIYSLRAAFASGSAPVFALAKSACSSGGGAVATIFDQHHSYRHPVAEMHVSADPPSVSSPVPPYPAKSSYLAYLAYSPYASYLADLASGDPGWRLSKLGLMHHMPSSSLHLANCLPLACWFRRIGYCVISIIPSACSCFICWLSHTLLKSLNSPLPFEQMASTDSTLVVIARRVRNAFSASFLCQRKYVLNYHCVSLSPLRHGCFGST